MQQCRDEETRKTITSLLMDGRKFFLLDNITRPLGGAAIDAALTGEMWSDRKLGSNESISLPMNLIFMATGNNVTVRGDLTRRLLRCRVSPDEECPETRPRFKLTDLLVHIRRSRHSLVMAVLALSKAYINAGSGRPDVGFKPLGSFQSWSQVVRSILVWLGEEDPVLSQDSLRNEADFERENALRFLVAWRGLFGAQPKSARDVVEAAQGSQSDERVDTLNGALAAVTADDVKPSTLSKRVLTKLKARNFGGLRLKRAEGRSKHGVLWVVEEV